MAFSINTVISDGVTTQYPVSFTNGIYDRANVFVYVQDDVDGSGNQLERAFTWINDGLIQLNVVAPVGKRVTIQRKMNRNSPDVDYEDGAILDEKNLDQSYDHLLNLIHEVLDGEGVAPGESTTDEITHNDGTNDVNLETFLNNLTTGASTTDIITHDTGTQTVNLETYLRALDTGGMYANVTDMLAGYNAAQVIYLAGGTIWRVDTVTNPMVIENYTALNDVNINAFGALEDGSNVSPAAQLAINYASPRKKTVRVAGTYTWGTTVELLDNSTLDCTGSLNTVDTGIGELFDASTSGSVKRYISIYGGDWTEAATDTTGTVTWLKAFGEYNGGSPIYIRDMRIRDIKLHNFWRGIDSEYNRSYAWDNLYMYARNGIRMGAKNVESSINQSTIFGSDSTNAATRGIQVSDGVTISGQYCEGVKISKCTVDRFGRSLSIADGLDYDFTDNWFSTGTNAAYHALYVTSDPNVNFFKGISFTGNKFKRGKIEFLSHAAPPTQADIAFHGNKIVDAPSTPITIGNSWFDIEIDGLTVDPAGGTGSVGILCQNNNERCRFDNIRFKGTWTRLLSINGSTSKETTAHNIWSDEPMDQPYYLETQIMITHSMAGKTPAESVAYGGQILWTEEVISTNTGGNPTSRAAFTPSLNFKQGAYIAIEIHGMLTHTAANGVLKITSTTAGVLESVASGSAPTWESSFVELTNSAQRVDAVYYAKVISSNATNIEIEAQNGDIVADTHSHMIVRYL